ncbi:MAG: hypothetical protein ACJ72D_27355, partial [Marmoricola sp.]
MAAKKTATPKPPTQAELQRLANKRIAAREARERARMEAFERTSPRILNTVTALQANGKQPEPTAYAGTRVLLARSAVSQELIIELTEVANSLGWTLDASDALTPPKKAHQATLGVARLELGVTGDGQIKKPDAWAFLQAVRAGRKRNAKINNVGL